MTWGFGIGPAQGVVGSVAIGGIVGAVGNLAGTVRARGQERSAPRHLRGTVTRGLSVRLASGVAWQR